MMKLLAMLVSTYFTISFLFLVIRADITFPLIYKWSKRSKDSSNQGCLDPTEPFQCPKTNKCISLQFLCDGHPGDCPDNYDEDPGLCIASKRPPKDIIRRLFISQYLNHGPKFIEYVFGSEALKLFKTISLIKAVDILSIALAASPTINEFTEIIDMTEVEKKRLSNLLESLNTGKVSTLPPFIVNTASEGLSLLANQLIKTNFLETDD